MMSRFLLLLLSLVVLLAGCHADVVKLTDSTFEHQTQASTGATTGSWLIMFHASSCASCQSLKLTLESLGEESELYENGIVLGSVDCDISINTAKRFQVSTIPTLIYIHKGRMFRFPQDGGAEERTVEILKRFVLEDYEKKSNAEGIPLPPSPFQELIDVYRDLTTADETGLLKYSIFGMLGILVGTIVMLVVTLLRGAKKSKSD